MNIYDFKVRDAKGEMVDLSDYKGKVLLVVNTATRCGLTPQYAGLEALYTKFRDQGFEILGFPCNQFNEQAPESAEEIVTFCSLNYGVTFRQFAKIEVNGEREHPLYTWLKSQKTGAMGDDIEWNFAKFLIDKNGNVVDRFVAVQPPEDLEAAIQALL